MMMLLLITRGSSYFDILLMNTRLLLVIHILAVEEMRKSRLKSTSVMLKQGNQCDHGMSYDSGRRPL